MAKAGPEQMTMTGTCEARGRTSPAGLTFPRGSRCRGLAHLCLGGWNGGRKRVNKRDFYKKETQFPSWRSRGCIGNGEGMDN